MTRSASIQNSLLHRTPTLTRAGLARLGFHRFSTPLTLGVLAACGFLTGTLRADEKIIISAPEKAITTPAAESKAGERPSSTTRELLKGVSTGELDAPSFVQPSGGLLLDAKSQKALLDVLTKKKNSESLVPDDGGFERDTADPDNADFDTDFQDDSDRRDSADRLESRSGLKNDKRDGLRSPGGPDRDRMMGRDRDRDQRRDRDGKNGHRVLPTLGDTPLVLTPESMTKSGNRSAALDGTGNGERIRISSPGDIQGALDGDRDLDGSLQVDKPDVGALSGVKDIERQQGFRQMLVGPKPTEGLSKAQVANPFGSEPDRQSQFQSLLKGTPASSASALPSGALPVNLSPPTALGGGGISPSSFSIPGSAGSGFAPSSGSLLPAPLPTPSAGPAGLRSQPIVLPIPRRF